MSTKEYKKILELIEDEKNKRIDEDSNNTNKIENEISIRKKKDLELLTKITNESGNRSNQQTELQRKLNLLESKLGSNNKITKEEYQNIINNIEIQYNILVNFVDINKLKKSNDETTKIIEYYKKLGQQIKPKTQFPTVSTVNVDNLKISVEKLLNGIKFKPSISISSLTINNNNVTFTVKITDGDHWHYQLDNEKEVVVMNDSSATITTSYGNHKITVFLVDSQHQHISSDTKDFTLIEIKETSYQLNVSNDNALWKITGRYTKESYQGRGSSILDLKKDIYKFEKIGPNWKNSEVSLNDHLNKNIFGTIGLDDLIIQFPIGKIKCYNFRIQPALWDYGGSVGEQWSMPFHQYMDNNGNVLTPGTPGGSWIPFIPGPTISGHIGDIICVNIQNRIEDPDEHFIKHLKTHTLVHWHGIEVSNCYDGTAVSQIPIPTGTDFTYMFQLVRPGLFWYHPHWNSIIQNSLGAYGAIICDDDTSVSLRNNNIIPHLDRTFIISLSEISFQNDREDANGNNYVPIADVATTNKVYIRDIMKIGGSNMDQNFGDTIIINGKHNSPLNTIVGNSQQFWKANRNIHLPIQVTRGESMSFYLTNSGLHRFYKVHLAYKTNLNNQWTKSNQLFIIGGEGGLLDQARQATGEFGDWKLKGIRKRADDEGLQEVQNNSELNTGEVLLPTASRIFVAFKVGKTWTELALRVNGFSVQNKSRTDDMINSNTYWADEDPNNMIIARFQVSNYSPTYTLSSDIINGSLLRTNPILGTNIDPLIDLRNEIAVTSFPHTKADLDANVMVPISGANIMQDYNIILTGSGGPGINGSTVFWNNTGISQDTYDNTRYLHEGDIVEWTMETTTANSDHPWHTHGFSFQPIKMELKKSDNTYQTIYEWDYVEYLDVIYVPYSHRLTYRFVVEDRPFIDTNMILYNGGVYGRWLAHCHIFKHAHKGMMMEFIVVDSNNSLTNRRFPTDVYIRDNTTDDGTVPSSGTISISPDVILRPSKVTNGNSSYGEGSNTENSSTLGYEVEFGQDNYIYVRLKNRSLDLNSANNVTTDLYWSEVPTLVTPDQWNYIGTTKPINVPTGDTLVVAEPVTWSKNDIPSKGHYCIVAITGNYKDPKILSKTQVANFNSSGMTVEEFYDLIRNNNNVTWRNFNVIDLEINKEGPFNFNYEFKFQGAFDKNRKFNLVINQPFGKILLKIPKNREYDSQIIEQVYKNKLQFVKGSDDRYHFIHIIGRKFEFKDLFLIKGKSYHSEIIIEDVKNTNNIIEKEFNIGQYYNFANNDLFEVGRITWKFVKNRHRMN